MTGPVKASSYAGEIIHTEPSGNFNLRYKSEKTNPVKSVNFFNHTGSDRLELTVTLKEGLDPAHFSLRVSADWKNCADLKNFVIWKMGPEGAQVVYDKAIQINGVLGNLVKIGFLPPAFANTVKLHINHEKTGLPEVPAGMEAAFTIK